MGLTVVGLAGSTCTSRVLATMFEKNVEDFKIKAVDFASGEHKKPEHLKLQPFGAIPVLQDGDFNIFESRAIARYVSEKFENQGTPLFGKTLKDRALVNQWLEVESQNYNLAASSIVSQVVFAKWKGLTTDEKVVEEHAESRAIARYVSEKFENQGTPLFGKTLKDRALVNQWLEVESQNYNPAASSIVSQVVFAKWKGLTTDEKVVEEQLAKLEKVLDVYEEHLSKNKYLAGDFFSMADLSHLPYTHFLVNVAKKGEGVTSRKHVNAWWEDISSRPAWKKVLELQAKK